MSKELVTNLNPIIKRQIDGILSEVPTQTLLYDSYENGLVYYSSANPQVITLTDSIANYDAVVVETAFIISNNYWINPNYIINPQVIQPSDKTEQLVLSGYILDVYNQDYQSSTKRMVVKFLTDTSLQITGVLNESSDNHDIAMRSIYGIKAISSDSGANNYSTDEIKIGKWINGKDLYRKVVDLGVIAVTPETPRLEIPHNISDIEMVIRVDCFVWHSASKQAVQFPYVFAPNQLSSIVYVEGANIIIRNADTNWVDYNFYTVIEYTKK